MTNEIPNADYMKARCPRCGSRLLNNGLYVWCSSVQPACYFGLDRDVTVDDLSPAPLASQLRTILVDVDEAKLATALVAIKPAVYVDALIDCLIDRLEVEPMAPERSDAIKSELMRAAFEQLETQQNNALTDDVYIGKAIIYHRDENGDFVALPGQMDVDEVDEEDFYGKWLTAVAQ
jgi:hypothetical protein